ncbi:MAG: nucleoside triphosphate pyrophosphohydrolase [Halanaerobiales bacterium]
MKQKKLQKMIVELVEIMKELRGPDGCPWDRQQTYKTLEPYIVEEAYEVIEAIEEEEPELIKDELGDLLFQVVFQAQIAEERGDFTLLDVIEGISEKMIRRHPHVFSDTDADSVEEVKSNWESIKDKEKDIIQKNTSLMDELAREQPALNQAEEVQKKAAMVGFDWSGVEGVLDKIEEEFFETREALRMDNYDELEEEVGDFLFSVVNLSRFYEINAEIALYKAVLKFKKRFKLMEKYARDNGDKLAENLTLDELESYWEKAKEEQSREE